MGVLVFDIENNVKVFHVSVEHENTNTRTKKPACKSLAWSTNGNLLYSGFTDGKIRTYRVKN